MSTTDTNHAFHTCQSLMRTLTRKPASYDQVALYSCDDLTIDAKQALFELPIYNDHDIISRGNAPYGDFIQPEIPVWFLMKARGKVYLVDTEGAQYCRYMVRLADISEEFREYLKKD